MLTLSLPPTPTVKTLNLKVDYDCPKCGKRTWAFRNFEGTPCVDDPYGCVQRVKQLEKNRKDELERQSKLEQDYVEELKRMEKERQDHEFEKRAHPKVFNLVSAKSRGIKFLQNFLETELIPISH